MPLYRLLAYAKPDAPAPQLSETFRSIARLVYREKGQFRHIRNLGVRPLAYPHRRPREKFDTARFVECTYDIRPKGLQEIERFLRRDDAVLRFFHLKDESELALFQRGEPKPERERPLTAAMRARGVFNPETMTMER